MEYYDCPVFQKLKKVDVPLKTIVPVDEYTKVVALNFDYEFNGESVFYPFKIPDLPTEFGICCIVGSSGTGKTTLLKEFLNHNYTLGQHQFDERAIISNFDSPENGVDRLSAVGLNSLPVWCRPRKYLSTGEGFRADLAININNFTLFDEFTSTINREVAISTCTSISKFIKKENIHNVIFSSCHKDFIDALNPDFVIDTDTKCVYDCRDIELKKDSSYTSMNPLIKMRGTYLGNITI